MGRRAAVAALAAVLLLPATTAHAGTPTPPPPPLGVHDLPTQEFVQETDTIIVTFEGGQRDPEQAATAAVSEPAGEVVGAEIVAVTPITAKTVAVTFDQTLTAEQAVRISDQVADSDQVRAAEPAATLTPAATNDTYYPYLWNLRKGSPSEFGVNAEVAWPVSTGSGSIVAVLDTGLTAHPDLAANVLPGYDFVSQIVQAGDGDGWDPDPADPGDNCSEQAEGSSWHGTHVAGIIAAVRDNGIGVVGVAPEAKVQPVRVLGRCGGSEADIIAAIRWGAGLPVTDVPANPTPADVLNLSLSGFGSCSVALQDAINAAVARGVVVVAAAGNEDEPLSMTMPASCDKVIRVTATTFGGDRAQYSNYGTFSYPATIAAPGGAGDVADDPNEWVISTSNQGSTGPGAPHYVGMAGTSMAAPHVAGVAALLKAKDPTLTPSRIQRLLVETATPLSGCSVVRCGAGVLNAPGALSALLGYPVTKVRLATSGVHLVGRTLTVRPEGANGIEYAYQWLRDGTPIPDAVAETYTLTTSDAGRAVAVRVTASYLGFSAPVTTDPVTVYETFTASVANPVIKGDPMPGGTLRASFPPSFGTDTVQWLRDGEPIDAGPTVPIGEDDIGHQYSVTRSVSFERDQVLRTSQPVTIVPNLVTRLEVPSISGVLRVGERLTGKPSGADGAAHSYQWLRNGKAISGATGASMVLTAKDRGKTLTVRVTASYLGETKASTSKATAKVRAGRFVKSAAPKVSGAFKKGATLKASKGVWKPGATIVKYRWYRNGEAISKATKAKYKLTSKDRGKYISVTVTLSRSGYATASATSKKHKVR